MAELIPINVAIVDRTYRIKIRPEDEALVRNTLKLINDKVIEFKSQFAGKDTQDFLAMVMIWYATQARSGVDPVEEKEMLNGIARLEALLDKVND